MHEDIKQMCLRKLLIELRLLRKGTNTKTSDGDDGSIGLASGRQATNYPRLGLFLLPTSYRVGGRPAGTTAWSCMCIVRRPAFQLRDLLSCTTGSLRVDQ